MNATHTNLLKGQTVRYDGRILGVKTGTIVKREVIPSYYAGGDYLVYYKLKNNAVLIPASDILDVVAN